MSADLEKELLDANEHLGKAIQALPQNEKDLVSKLYGDVAEFATQQEIKGIVVDRGAFFAAGIIFHQDLNNEALIHAAVSYIEKDWLFVKEKREDAAQTAS